jgi:competence protein ComGC
MISESIIFLVSICFLINIASIIIGGVIFSKYKSLLKQNEALKELVETQSKAYKNEKDLRMVWESSYHELSDHLL